MKMDRDLSIMQRTGEDVIAMLLLESYDITLQSIGF